MDQISILTIGDSSCDNILEVSEQDTGFQCDLKSHKCEITFNYGEKIPVRRVHLGHGGSALNCAAGFRKLGLSAKIATIIGNDDPGKGIIRFLHERGIGLNLLKVAGETNLATIISYKGERTIFSYHALRDYNLIALEKADWVYFASAGQGSDILIREVLNFKNSGSKLVFNPGAWQLKNFSKFKDLVKNCDAFIINRVEADLILGEVGKIRSQLQKMCEMGAKIAVITDGKNGAYFSSSGNSIHLNATVAQNIDSTGAGDAFSSGFIGALAMGKSLEESAKWGMVNSGSAIEKFTASAGLLNTAQIEERISQIKSFKATILS